MMYQMRAFPEDQQKQQLLEDGAAEHATILKKNRTLLRASRSLSNQGVEAKALRVRAAIAMRS